MSDAERIALVERYRLDVWHHSGTNPTVPPGWVADLGDPDPSLWIPGDVDGGSSLAVAQPDWRSAVDEAARVIDALGILPPPTGEPGHG